MGLELIILVILTIGIGLCVLPVIFEIFSLITSLVLELLLLGLAGPILCYQFLRGRFYTQPEGKD